MFVAFVTNMRYENYNNIAVVDASFTKDSALSVSVEWCGQGLQDQNKGKQAQFTHVITRSYQIHADGEQ